MNGPNSELKNSKAPKKKKTTREDQTANGRPYNRQLEADDSPPPFMTVVNEADSSGRKVDAMETLNPHDLDRARSFVDVAPSGFDVAVTSGFHQADLRRHHHQDSAATSSRDLASYLARVQPGNDAVGRRGDDAVVEGFKREMKDLEELLSKLNPMAEEFVPSSLAGYGNGGGWLFSNTFSFQNGNADANAGPSNRVFRFRSL